MVQDRDESEAPKELRSVRDNIEWDCNETNNHHCRVVTEVEYLDGLCWSLKVQPRTDETGEPLETTGWAKVIRDMVHASKKRENLALNAKPGKLLLMDSGGLDG